jgi:hypothetical protein
LSASRLSKRKAVDQASGLNDAGARPAVRMKRTGLPRASTPRWISYSGRHANGRSPHLRSPFLRRPHCWCARGNDAKTTEAGNDPRPRARHAIRVAQSVKDQAAGRLQVRRPRHRHRLVPSHSKFPIGEVPSPQSAVGASICRHPCRNESRGPKRLQSQPTSFVELFK